MFVNCTPHAITIRLATGDVTIPPSGNVARCQATEVAAGERDGIPLVTRVMGEVQGLPASVEGTVYVVGSMVLDAAQGRSDLAAPDTGTTAIREGGQVKAVIRLVVKS